MILALIVIALIFWAIDWNPKKLESYLSFTVMWIRRLYTLQICLIAFH
jgi:hypothetical protein